MNGMTPAGRDTLLTLCACFLLLFRATALLEAGIGVTIAPCELLVESTRFLPPNGSLVPSTTRTRTVWCLLPAEAINVAVPGFPARASPFFLTKMISLLVDFHSTLRPWRIFSRGV